MRSFNHPSSKRCNTIITLDMAIQGIRMISIAV